MPGSPGSGVRLLWVTSIRLGAALRTGVRMGLHQIVAATGMLPTASRSV